MNESPKKSLSAETGRMTQAEATEAAKTEKQKAADVTYTLNHAFACMGTDVLVQPIVGDLTQKYFDHRVEVGCTIPGHDHGDASLWGFLKKQFPALGGFFTAKGKDHDPKDDHHNCTHDHEHHDHKPKKSYGLNYLFGEFVGDVLAVPVTIFMQRHAPNVMHGIRRVMEPVFRPLFKFGARNAANKWAWQHGLPSFSDEAKAHAKELYEHEASHLPQAAVWTISSIGISIAAQKMAGNPGSVREILQGKINGSVISALLLLGFRGLAPKAAQGMDQFTSQKIFLPATKKVGHLFGVKQEDAEKALAAPPEAFVSSWSEKILSSPATPMGKTL